MDKLFGIVLLLAAVPHLTGCVLPISSACADTLRDVYPSMPADGLIFPNPNDFDPDQHGIVRKAPDATFGPAAPCKS